MTPSDDWFRNEVWSADISRRFDEKLRRARRKEQYLRIQASILAPTHPAVALELLDRYFSMSDKFDHAQAHVGFRYHPSVGLVTEKHRGLLRDIAALASE